MKEKIEKVKTHIKEHKEAYIAGTVGVVVGATGVYIAVRNGNGAPEIANKVHQKIRQIGLRNEANQVCINLIERSTPSKPVKMIAKDGVERYFSSLNEAARQTGHGLAKISRNVNGHIPDVNGDKFELLDVVA